MVLGNLLASMFVNAQAGRPAADTVEKVDSVFFFIIAISVVLLVGITLFMVYCVVRYSRGRNPSPAHIEGNKTLEILWTVIPTIIVLAMFYYGWEGFAYMRATPPDARVVKVTARKWSWYFEYSLPGGKTRPSDELVLPVNEPVKILLKSEDVIHSFYASAFRVKEDAVPGLPTYLWFTPKETGRYDLLCAEYCGEAHSRMRAVIRVVPAKEFDEFLNSPVPKKLLGGILYRSKCASCHTTDGAKGIGPTFKGVWGRKSTVTEDGKDLTVDVTEEYIRESMTTPAKKVVKGFPPVMIDPKLSPEEIDAIVEYLKEIK